MSYFAEYFTTFTILASITAGSTFYGWPAPSLPFLQSNESPIIITQDESLWIIWSMMLGCILGPFLGSFLAHNLGRKVSLLVTGLPYIIGWILTLVADTVSWIFVARFLAGIGYSIAYSVTPMYIGEIASDKIRGALGTMIAVMIQTGLLITYSICSYVPYRVPPYILIFFPIILLLSSCWMPETPYYYLINGRKDDAMSILEFLRSDNDQEKLQVEIEPMIKCVNNKKGIFKALFLTRGNRKGLIIMFVCISAMQLSGISAVTIFAEQLIEGASSSIGHSESRIIVCAAQVVLALISSALVDNVGRRPLLLISTAGVSITNLIFGIFFICEGVFAVNVVNFSWLLVLAVAIHIPAYMLGLGTVTFVLLSELFSTDIKAVAAAVLVTSAAVLNFAVASIYPIISDEIGQYLSFWLFAVICGSCFVVLVYIMPETKKLSLAEIQIMLNKK